MRVRAAQMLAGTPRAEKDETDIVAMLSSDEDHHMGNQVVTWRGEDIE
jgi:hypothetical protein